MPERIEVAHDKMLESDEGREGRSTCDSTAMRRQPDPPPLRGPTDATGP